MFQTVFRKLVFYYYSFDVSTRVQGPYLQELSRVGWDGVSSPFLVSRDGGSFLVIHDGRRSEEHVHHYYRPEKDVYQFCDRIRPFEEIAQRFNAELSLDRLQTILRRFCNAHLMVKEANAFLSLAIQSNRG